MAWLESRGSTFCIRFRYDGRKHLFALRYDKRREAEESLRRFEEHLRLMEKGILPLPEKTGNIGVYILSGGKLTNRPGSESRVGVPTIDQLFNDYETSLLDETKEESTLLTERIHLKHLRRLVGADTRLSELSDCSIQDYVDARLKEAGRHGHTIRPRTVKKEIATFKFVWNQIALGLANFSGAFGVGRSESALSAIFFMFN